METGDAESLNLLFVCSRNQWRSPTAERIWSKRPGILARSAGTSSSARRRVSSRDLEWADVVLVMEHKHKSRLVADYARILELKPLHVLDIPDDYRFMDPELIELLDASVRSVLDSLELQP